MSKITIDENRKQISGGSGYSMQGVVGTIRVDMLSPSVYHTLKGDYKDFALEEQWEISPDNQEESDSEERLAEAYAEELNNLIWGEVKKNKKGKLTPADIIKVNKKIK